MAYSNKYGIFGPMFSGKTSKLFDVVKYTNVNKYAILKPTLDTRDPATIIKTHSGKVMNCMSVSDNNHVVDIISSYDTILIDEVQFFNIVLIKQLLTLANKKIYFAGLDMSYKRKYFTVTKYLIETLYPQNIMMLSAICKCGNPAPLTKCISVNKSTMINNEPVLIGGADKYEPSCIRCFGN